MRSKIKAQRFDFLDFLELAPLLRAPLMTSNGDDENPPDLENAAGTTGDTPLLDEETEAFTAAPFFPALGDKAAPGEKDDPAVGDNTSAPER